MYFIQCMCETRQTSLSIRPIPSGQTHALRQRVLRPHQAIQEMVYPGDDAPGSFHMAALDAAGEVQGIASFYVEPHPLDPCEGDWRLRGMAVEPRLQGQGLGGRLVAAGLDHIREQGGKRLWCNARVAAQRFYERIGFVAEGQRFEIPTIGPHDVMSIAIA